MDKSKLLKMLIVLSMIVVVAGVLTRLVRRDSMSLTEYAALHSSDSTSEGNSAASGNAGGEDSSAPENMAERDPSMSGNTASDPAGSTAQSSRETPETDSTPAPPASDSIDGSQASVEGDLQASAPSQLTGAALNGNSQMEQRVSLAEGFYYEPLSDNLRRYITGVTYPAVSSEEEAKALAVSYDDLRYVHVLHYDFDGESTEGELICNEYIAQDLVEIFHELYYNEYQIQRILLIDEYDGDDTASMEDNNTSCFNYRVVSGSSHLSKHAYGLAIDINPLYNPYVAYEKDGTQKVSPAAALEYADRSASFPYKIDEEDLCCRLFKEHGFIWGGNWNSMKDYQHFQKTPKS